MQDISIKIIVSRYKNFHISLPTSYFWLLTIFSFWWKVNFSCFGGKHWLYRACS